MAITKNDKLLNSVSRDISYLNKDFSQWKQSLIDYSKSYFPEAYSDFNESSPGMIFIELMSYVGDVLSYYIDSQFKENLINYAEETDSIIAIAQGLGYKPKPATAATTDVTFFQLCPALDVTKNFEIDTRFLLTLSENTVVASTDFGGVKFRSLTEVNFADPYNREITIYSVNNNGEPTMYLVRKTITVVSGDIRTFTTTIGSPQKFTKITIPDNNVLEVLSVKDSNGFQWYEVDYLAQDLIINSVTNTNPTVASSQSPPPPYVLNIKREPRRFITRYNADYTCELQFGSGLLDDFDSSINIQPSKIASSEYNQNLASTSIDPSDFLLSKSYGLAPNNVTMTVTYVTGGGLESNVPSNTINKVQTYLVKNDTTALSSSEQTLFNDIVNTLAVSNPLPATGGKGADSIEEIRQNTLAFFNAQNRAVTPTDYTVRSYAMPPKFGGIAKAFVATDDQINNIMSSTVNQITGAYGSLVQDRAGKNIINLYVLGYDNNKNLVTLNNDVKQNLSKYIDQYRVLTDEIRILDAFIVNIGVNFDIVIFKNYNMNEVLVRCIDVITKFFDIDHWKINQPIIIVDLVNVIASVDGVRSVNSVKIVNKYAFSNGAGYSNFIYDIEGSALSNGVVYPSLDPTIFEIKYPQKDIIGTASQ